MKCNYHTHCTYCDGKEPMPNFVAKAVELGYDHLGFSSHAPIAYRNDFAIQENEIPNYLADIETLQHQNPQITLYAALECDFIPGLTKPFQYFKEEFHLDYIIGGVHLVESDSVDRLWFIDGSKREIYDNGLRDFFGGDVKKAVTTFWEQTFQMIETERFDIVAHIDKIKMHNQDRYFTEEEKWYRALALHALELVKRQNLIIEINSRGLYKGRCSTFYPADFILEEVARLQIPCIISSDAHLANELPLYYDEALATLRRAGIRTLVALQNGSWEEYEIG